MHLLFGGNFGNKAITKKSCSKNSAKQSSIFTAPYLINTNSNNEKHFNWTVMLFWNLYYIFEMVQIWFIFHFYTIKRKLVITVFKLVSFRVKNNCTGKYATSTFNYWFVHHVMIQYQIQMYLAIWTNFLTFYVRFGWGKLAFYYGFFPLDISSLLNWTSICSQKYHLLHLSLSLSLSLLFNETCFQPKCKTFQQIVPPLMNLFIRNSARMTSSSRPRTPPHIWPEMSRRLNARRRWSRRRRCWLQS